MPKLILTLFAMITIVGAAAGGYVYFIAPASAESGHKEEKKKKEISAKYKNAKYVDMGRIILPLIDDNGVSQMIHMTVKLAVPGKKAAKKAEKLRPRIRDAYLQDMYGTLRREAAIRGGVLRVKVISGRLKSITTKILGADNIHDVLVQSIQQRPS